MAVSVAITIADGRARALFRELVALGEEIGAPGGPLDAIGAEIVNDISGLRFDPAIADEVAKTNAGLILMHSRGTPKDMHQLPPVDDVLERSHQRPAAKRRPRRIARHFAREHGNSISASGAFAGPPRCA